MLYLVGVGLKPEHLSIEASMKIKECEEVFLETYTSVFSEGSVEELQILVGKKIKKLLRKDVEENFEEVFEKAKEKKIALLVFGNPLSATTHQQILIDAKEKGIPVEVLPGISVLNFVAKSGLSEYRLGRTTTIVFHEKNFEPTSFYEVIEKNFSNGMHTLCLLDIKAEKNKLMSVREALEILEKIEKKRKKKILQKAVLFAIAKAGSKDERIVFGKIEKLKKVGLGVPAVLIVAAPLNEKEREFAKKLVEKIE